jgi:hypothetical protein
VIVLGIMFFNPGLIPVPIIILVHTRVARILYQK